MAEHESAPTIALVHGVNLDALGRRDPGHYGTLTLAELERRVADWAREAGFELDAFQTNHEGELCEHLHGLGVRAAGVIINAGAWTHYSWALRDALEVAGLPAVEVHLSDIEAREEWRRASVLDGLVEAKLSGQGPEGYRRAIEILAARLGPG